jgi:hypothetical protein
MHEPCIICAEQVQIYSIGPCNHPVCHLCSLRLIALYKSRHCPLCKVEIPNFVFTKKLRDFSEFDTSRGSGLDGLGADLPIYFDDRPVPKSGKKPKKNAAGEKNETSASSDSGDVTIKDQVAKILRLNCPASDCEYVGEDYKQLKRHVRQEHKMNLW